MILFVLFIALAVFYSAALTASPGVCLIDAAACVVMVAYLSKMLVKGK